MKKDNEAKIKEILNELEDELLEENGSDKTEEIIEKTEKLSERNVEEVIEESKEEEAVKENLSEKSKKKQKDERLELKESPIRQIGIYLIGKLNKYKYILILNFVVFLFLFFLIPTVILEVKPVIWITLFLIFTILPTVAFYLKKLFKKYQVMIGIPFFYLCILCILDSCTIKDLYGITSHGSLDKTPAWIDAILVTFIIVFFQYIGLTVIDFVQKHTKLERKKNNK